MLSKESIIAMCILNLVIIGGCKSPTVQPPYHEVEWVDTSDCSLLITSSVLDAPTLLFSTKKKFQVKSDSMPILEMTLMKQTPDDDYSDNLMITFELGSTVCVVQGPVTLAFDDTTGLVLDNREGENCNGDATISLHRINKPTQFVVNPNLKRVRIAKFHAITFETKKGKRTYVLSDIEATNLKYLLNCLHTAK